MDFYKKVQAAKFQNPTLIFYNSKLSEQLQIPEFDLKTTTDFFSGQQLMSGSEPLALTYAGHQFGHFVPQLGDGRALLLGEVLDTQDRRWDIQLKGSGPTPFSRGGDGLAPLGPMLREYIVSEAMHALGVPTTRALALVTTGDPVSREKNLPGAILTRVASSHIRIGTFEFFASRNDFKNLKILADYAIHRHYPDLIKSSNPYLLLLKQVLHKQALLIAKWMTMGFIHGVMNTDNMTISGETIDYGPCAFIDFYDSKKVYSAIDRQGRYAFNKQAQIAKWNLSVFASTLLPLIADPTNQNFGSNDDYLDRKNLYTEENIQIVQNELDQFEVIFKYFWLQEMRQKLGFTELKDPSVRDSKEFHENYKLSQDDLTEYDLAQSFLNLLESQKVDFTLAFRALAESLNLGSDFAKFRQLFLPHPDLEHFLQAWTARNHALGRSHKTVSQTMMKKNPTFIPRNHLLDQAIKDAEIRNDFTLASKIFDIVTQPFRTATETELQFTYPPKPEEQIKNTFCGT